MAGTPYDEAIEKRVSIAKRLSELKDERQALETELAELDSFVKMWHRLTGTKPEQTSPEARTPSRPTRPKNPPREDVGDLVESVLKETGTPMMRANLFAAIQERGMKIHGKDPEMVFSTMLWRMRDRFVRLKDYGYWLAHVPYEPAGYYPDGENIGDLLS